CLDLASEAEESLGRDDERSRVLEFGQMGRAPGDVLGGRLLVVELRLGGHRRRGLYSHNNGISIPESLIFFIAYHTAASHHAVHGPCGKARPSLSDVDLAHRTCVRADDGRREVVELDGEQGKGSRAAHPRRRRRRRRPRFQGLLLLRLRLPRPPPPPPPPSPSHLPLRSRGDLPTAVSSYFVAFLFDLICSNLVSCFLPLHFCGDWKQFSFWHVDVDGFKPGFGFLVARVRSRVDQSPGK
ncbi:hypothetical protein GW17_00057297, partial [Ensete ventricosum]